LNDWLVLNLIVRTSYQVFFSFKISYQYLKNTTQSYVCWSVPCLNIEYTYIQVGGIRYLMSLSTIFQLYRGSQFYWGRKPEYIEKTTDLSQVTLSYNVVSSTPRLSKIWTHVNGDPMYKETFLLSNKNYYNYRYSDNYFWQICALWQWQSRRKNNQMLSRACIVHLVIKKKQLVLCKNYVLQW
jgi:hypothetical protein